MLQLTVRGLSRQFDSEPVFENVSFEVRTGEKIGLIGPNGSGKSTLLRVLAAQDEPDAGVIDCRSGIEIAMLEQEARFRPGQTLREEAASGLAPLYALQETAHRLAEQMAAEPDHDSSEKLHRQYDQVQHELHRLDAYNIDHRVDEVLDGLGFSPEDHDRRLDEFSGGQQSRVLLARLLLQSPDVMLLDEPTNHLDIAATEWLETYLTAGRRAVILVSHDRYFLDRVTGRTLELFNRTLTDYRGNFSAYRAQRAERNKVLQRTWERQQEFIEKTEDFIRRNRYGQKHAQAADRQKKLQRIEPVSRPMDLSGPAMNFGRPDRSGDWLIDAQDVSKGFGTPLFTDVTLRVHRGDRIGIFGPNGSGKTTLLRTLIGDLKPDSGTVRLGTGVKIGYYDQHLGSLDPGWDVLEAVRPSTVTSGQTIGEMRGLLARFGIRGDVTGQKVGSLSGGEKSKVALARIAAEHVNLLILDEPTNHLDLWACEALEQTLHSFDGTLLFVSHDRYFLDRVAKSVIVLEPDCWRFHAGNYSDCIRFVETRNQDVPPEEPSRTSSPIVTKDQPEKAATRKSSQGKRRRRFPYRKVSDIETEIAEYEELVQQLQNDLATPEVHRDGERARETLAAFEETRQRLDELYEHWEEAVELN